MERLVVKLIVSAIYIILFNYNNYINYFIDLSIWRKIRKIIIALKYNQENTRLLKAQIKAFNIEKYNIPQLSK